MKAQAEGADLETISKRLAEECILIKLEERGRLQAQEDHDAMLEDNRATDA